MSGTPPRYAQGTPCWVSLLARDLDTAERFYGPLLGWDFAAGPTDLGPYLRAVVDGLPVAGVGVMPEGSDFAVDWITYFAADDADEVAQQVRDRGGTLAMGPLEFGRSGRMAVAADLDGAVFGIWQGREHLGWERQHEPGTAAWSELATPEAERATRFYAGAFGSSAVESGSARVHQEQDEIVLKVGGRMVAGIRNVHDLEDRPRWRIHFAVRDVELAVGRARELGGGVEQAPADTPYGRAALLRDAEDGPFAVVQLS